MKKFKWSRLWIWVLFIAGFFVLFQSDNVEAKEKKNDVIISGVFAENVELSGLTEEEALDAITEYIESLKNKKISLKSVENQEVVVTAGDLGLIWKNPEIISDAISLGTEGNIIHRYKARKDLEYENRVFEIELDFDMTKINDVLAKQCTQFDQPAKDFTLIREDGAFQVVDGQVGYVLDIEKSIDVVFDYLVEEWNGKDAQIELVVDENQPKGNEETLFKVGDVLGTFTTSFKTSGQNRSANIKNGCRLINQTVLYPGDEFSMLETVTPFSQANGYFPAGSYLSGKVVDSVGGGICQVSTTLYNAVLNAELEVTERQNHSMIVHYVDLAMDAAVAQSANKDFKFVNSKEYPIYIEGVVSSDKSITFTIYGYEDRPENRSIRYENKVLSKIAPGPAVIIADAAQPVGAIQTQGAFVGYKTELWKVVTVDGKETERIFVNKSNYKMIPRTATVGVATADANAYNEIMSAIGTGNIDHVKNVAAAIQAAQSAPATP